MTKVSVVSGYYNRAHVLDRTITSIMNQSFKDFEFILFDDASKDGTADKLRAIESSLADPRLRFKLYDQNVGFVEGLRRSVSASSGEYIAIQGSGDVSHVDRLAKQVAYLDDNPDVAAVGSWYMNISADGQNSGTVHRPDASNFTFADLCRSNCFTHGEVMIRRSAYDAVGGYRSAFSYAQDRDLWLRLRKHFSLATVPEVLYWRYTELDGVSFTPSKIIRQRMLSSAAVKLAMMPEQIGATAYIDMAENGVERVVDLADPVVQAPLFKMVLNLALVHSVGAARDLARDGMTDPHRRRLVLTVLGIYNFILFRPLQPLVAKLAKAWFQRK